MYKTDGSQSDKAKEVFSNTAFMDAERYNAIFGQDRYYCCGDNTWAYTTSNEHKYKVWYYSNWKGKWREDTEKHTYVFMGNRWYIMRHRWQESYIRDDRWDSYYCWVVPGHEYNLDHSFRRNYDDRTHRNYWKVYDHNTYIKVKAYHFDGSFYNQQTKTYKDGFVNFDISRRR